MSNGVLKNDTAGTCLNVASNNKTVYFANCSMSDDKFKYDETNDTLQHINSSKFISNDKDGNLSLVAKTDNISNQMFKQRFIPNTGFSQFIAFDGSCLASYRNGNKYDYKYETCSNTDKGHRYIYDPTNSTIKNIESEKCMYVEDNGKDIGQIDCNNSKAKDFSLDSEHRITSKTRKLCLGDAQNNTLMLQDCMNSNQNYWFV